MKRFQHFLNLLVLIALTTCMNARGATIEPLDKPQPVTDFQLADQHGKAFTLENLKGHWSLLFLGFTSCPDVCPMTLTRLEAVRAETGLRLLPEQLPRIVFLAVDPARDLAVLEKYMAHFHPEHIGISGAPAQIDRLVKNLGEFYRIDKSASPGGHYDVVHSASVLVINPEAEVIAKIQPPLPVEATANFLNLAIRNHAATQVAGAR